MTGVGAIPKPLRLDALRLVYSQEDPDQQEELSTQGLERIESDGDPADGLIGCWEDDRVIAAIWLTEGVHDSATLGSPGVDPERFDWSTHPAIMLQLVDRFAKTHNIRWLQALFTAVDVARWGKLLQQTGFIQPAELDYYLLGLDEVAAETGDLPPAGFQWQAASAISRDAMEQLVSETFIDTQDCPFLQEHRTTHEVVDGFVTSGVSQDSHWRILCHDDRPIGCLLANLHRDPSLIEWVYVGLIPEFRGQGLSKTLCQGGLAHARSLGCQHVVVAVDGANAPAIQMYQRAGFQAWARRTLYVKCP